MRGTRTLKIVSDTLQPINFPSVRRPAIKPCDPPTQELVQWAIKVFVYSLILHVRTVILGLIELAECENVAASAPVCRHIFEWAALTCYVSTRVQDAFSANDWKKAWDSMTKVAYGSFWIKSHGGKYADNPPVSPPIQIPVPVYIPEAVTVYEGYQSQRGLKPEARESYSFLCDFGHANGSCLMRFKRYESNGAVSFGEPDLDSHESFLPFVNVCLIDLLTFIKAMLELASDTEVLPGIDLALDTLIRLAPAHLMGSVPA